MRSIIAIFLNLAFCLNCFCQSTSIVLAKNLGHIPNSTVRILLSDDDSSALRIPVGIDLKFRNYYYTSIAPIEEAYRKYKNNLITRDALLARAKAINRFAVIDSEALEKKIQKFPSSKIHFISGIDKVGNKIIAVDANQDGMISQNEVYIYTPDMIRKIEGDPANAVDVPNTLLSQRAADGTVRSINVKIMPYSFGNRTTNTNNKATTDISLLRNEYWKADVSIRGQRITLYAQPVAFSKELNTYRFTVEDEGNIDQSFYQVGDTWPGNKISFKIDSAAVNSRDELKVFVTASSTVLVTGDTTFTMAVQNASTSKYETLSAFLHKKRYVLIDYWGTWCIPCIAKIPALKELSGKYADKLSLISIAYDENVTTVNTFDIAHGITWNSYFIDRNVRPNLTKPLKVSAYPTFRLYSATGKLIFEGDKNPDKDIETINTILAENK